MLPNASVAVARTLVRCGVPAHAQPPYALAVVVPSYTSAWEPLAENTSIVHAPHDVPQLDVADIGTDDRRQDPLVAREAAPSRLMAPTRFA